MATEPTRQQQELAFRQLRRPNRWPATLDDCLRHPVFSVCINAMARQLGRPAWQGHPAAPSLPRGPVPPTPTGPARVVRPPSPITDRWSNKRGVDMKRRAANDHDDTDD